MPILRNPFRKAPADQCTEDTGFAERRPYERSGPSSDSSSSASKPLSIRPNGQPAPTEYKLSEINDSGVFIPPSPPETNKSFWSSRSGTSTRSSSHRSVLNENEPFNISRESFDSYRRSFDISARSPVLESAQRGRQSLDARRTRLPPPLYSQNGSPKHLQMTPSAAADTPQDMRPIRPAATPYQPAHLIGLTDKHVNLPTAQPEEPENPHPPVPEEEDDADTRSSANHGTSSDRFEDVGLGNDAAAAKNRRKAQPPPPHHQQYPPTHSPITNPKKPGIFSRFTAGGSTADSTSLSSSNTADGGGSRPGSSGIGLGLASSGQQQQHHHHGIFGRKRGGSGQGAELGSLHGKQSSIGSSTIVPEVKVDN